jgi:hypothetical protein
VRATANDAGPVVSHSYRPRTGTDTGRKLQTSRDHRQSRAEGELVHWRVDDE